MRHISILLALGLLLSLTLAELPILAPGVNPLFEDYLVLFSKHYQDSEKAYRQDLYEAERSRVIQFNSVNTLEKQAINNYSDWSSAQKSRLSGNQPSYSQPQGFTNTQMLRSTLASSGGHQKLQSAASLDWRLLGAVTPIQDQGACGACWAFATVAQAESHAIIRNRATSSIGLSEQFLLKCNPGSSCGGGYLQTAANVIISKGCPERSEHPYSPTSTSTSVCNSASSYFKVAKKASFYYDLTDSEIITLLQTSPLAIAVSSHQWTGYSTGIKTCTSSAVLDHAVQLVGYDTTHWIVKNQWGTSWGQSGYIHINRARTNAYTNCFVGSIVVQFQGDPSGEAYYFLAHMLLLVIFMLI